jgi:hypothetical protein
MVLKSYKRLENNEGNEDKQIVHLLSNHKLDIDD